MRSKANTSDRSEETVIDRARRRQFIECAIDALAELGFASATIAEAARRSDRAGEACTLPG